MSIPDAFPEVTPDFRGPVCYEVRPDWRSGRGRWWRPNGNGYTDNPDEAGIFDNGDRVRGSDRSYAVAVALVADLAVARRPVTAAAKDVLAEREKQRRKWGDAHDDEHELGTISVVAAALAVHGTDAKVVDPLDRADAGGDAWGLVAKHPKRRDQLVIAAALILAEIERIDRSRP